MSEPRCSSERPPAAALAALRADLAAGASAAGPCLAFGLAEIDLRLARSGLEVAGLHEVAAASAELTDAAAATLFLAGIAARFAHQAGSVALWAVTAFDLYAPGLEQAGLGPGHVLYAEARKDIEILAIAEDALRDGALGCVVAEVRVADMTATRRLQLAAADSGTPMLLYRRHRSRERCPLAAPSAATTRWRIGSAPSAPLASPGIGRARWHVELVRQRGGNPFILELEACDATGRLALPAPPADRAGAAERAASRVA